MPQYVVLIYEDESGFEREGAGELAMADHMGFAEKNGPTIRGGNALQPAATATTIRGFGADDFTVTDGPFVETKEALGGFYVIEAADLDEAIEIAKQVPARYGGVEVRPVMVFD